MNHRKAGLLTLFMDR